MCIILMELVDLIEINKIFSDGKILKESEIKFTLSTIKENRNWQQNLTYLVETIICGHTFLNGNKRTAAALILYYFNKHKVIYNKNLIAKAVIAVAKMKKPNFKKIQREINKCLI